MPEDICQACDEADNVAFLAYDEQDRWLVLGVETTSPDMVLAAMLTCVSGQPAGEA